MSAPSPPQFTNQEELLNSGPVQKRLLVTAVTYFLNGPRQSSPGGVGDVDPSEVDALAAHDEERGEAEQGHAAADHGQLGRLTSPQLQLLDDVTAQDDAHAGAGHDDHTWGSRRARINSIVVSEYIRF